MRILIAEDHQLYRNALAQAVQTLDENVSITEAKDWHSALAAALPGEFNLALLDLGMPGMESFAGLTAFLQQNPLTPTVVVSASESLHDMKRVLAVGAMGYISKSESTTIILHALSLVMSGGIYIPARMLDAQTTEDIHNTQLDTLTPQQHKVFCAAARGLSNKEIAQEMNISVPTVKSHISSIFRALNISKRYELLRLAESAGIERPFPEQLNSGCA